MYQESSRIALVYACVYEGCRRTWLRVRSSILYILYKNILPKLHSNKLCLTHFLKRTPVECWLTARTNRLSPPRRYTQSPSPLRSHARGSIRNLGNFFENELFQGVYDIFCGSGTVIYVLPNKFFRTEIVSMRLAVQVFVLFVVIAGKREVGGSYFVPKDPHQIHRTLYH